LAGAEPLAFNGGDTNLYRYVGNEPTDFIDPDGLQQQGPIGVPNIPLKSPSYNLIAPPFGTGIDKKRIYDSKPITPTQLNTVPNPTLDIGVGV
jgi:hypothetical protein